jgi:steroid 5-alpha reductase family enzyme
MLKDHFKKLDHIAFLVMIFPIFGLFILNDNVPTKILIFILVALWGLALGYDLYEDKQRM